MNSRAMNLFNCTNMAQLLKSIAEQRLKNNNKKKKKKKQNKQNKKKKKKKKKTNKQNKTKKKKKKQKKNIRLTGKRFSILKIKIIIRKKKKKSKSLYFVRKCMLYFTDIVAYL